MLRRRSGGGDPREVADVEGLAAQAGIDPGRVEDGGGSRRRTGPTRQRRTQRFASLPEGRVDYREDRVPVDIGRGSRSKTVRPMVAIRRTSAYHATFADGTP
jgi:hypothetical protein